MSEENKATSTKTTESKATKSKAGSFKRHTQELGSSFDRLAAGFITEIKTKYRFPESATSRIHELLNYTCLGGKLNRGGLVLNTIEHLNRTTFTQLSQDIQDKGLACAWAIEALQAMFLVADDVMDASLTRRGQPCWYKKPEVQLDAVNDSLILESFVYYLLKRFFGSDMVSYCAINDLYREVSLQTQLGQMLDLTSQPQGRKDPAILKNFTLDNYHRIITYKTAFYSFYLPIAAGMIVSGLNPNSEQDAQSFTVARDISVALGVKFQIQDDYLDCFGDYMIMGKVGTDIKDHKCSWLCAIALSLMTAEQRALFESHYGKESKEDEDMVRALYTELGLPEIYLKQEEESLASISSVIQANAEALPPAIFSEILNKIHLRQK